MSTATSPASFVIDTYNSVNHVMDFPELDPESYVSEIKSAFTAALRAKFPGCDVSFVRGGAASRATGVDEIDQRDFLTRAELDVIRNKAMANTALRRAAR